MAARIGDPGWAGAIPPDRPTMLVADGLMGFLSEPVIVNLFQTLTDHFRTVGWATRTPMKLAPQRSVKAFGRTGTTPDSPMPDALRSGTRG